MEVIVVVIILGTVMAFALPRYFGSMETVRSREGVSLLTALMGAQKRYALENSGAFTNNINNLDLTIPPSANFSTVTVANNNPGVIATVQRDGANSSYGSYTLTITDTGTIACAGGTGGICSKIGY